MQGTANIIRRKMAKEEAELTIVKEGYYWCVSYKEYADFGDSIENALFNLIKTIYLGGENGKRKR